MDELYLSCDDGGEDTLCLELYGVDESTHGFIQISYGFVSYNDEGNIDDCCDEGIDYQTKEITGRLESVVSDFEKYVLKEKETRESIVKIFELEV